MLSPKHVPKRLLTISTQIGMAQFTCELCRMMIMLQLSWELCYPKSSGDSRLVLLMDALCELPHPSSSSLVLFCWRQWLMARNAASQSSQSTTCYSNVMDVTGSACPRAQGMYQAHSRDPSFDFVDVTGATCPRAECTYQAHPRDSRFDFKKSKFGARNLEEY